MEGVAKSTTWVCVDDPGFMLINMSRSSRGNAVPELGERPRRERVTWMAGEEFLVDNIQPTFKSSPKFLLLWGCMAQGYKGPLIWLDLASDMGQQGQEGKTRDRKGGLDGK